MTGEEEAKRGAKSEHRSGPNQVDKRRKTADESVDFVEEALDVLRVRDRHFAFATEFGHNRKRQASRGAIGVRAIAVGTRCFAAITMFAQPDSDRLSPPVDDSPVRGGYLTPAFAHLDQQNVIQLERHR